MQGTALDQLGRHDEARRYYASALKIVPEEPSVLSNLGMSYVLSKDLPKAEENLRRAYGSAAADTRVRQNLGLVVGLQGRFAEAETIVKADLPPEEAAANVAYLKQMLSRKDGPRGGGRTVPVPAQSSGLIGWIEDRIITVIRGSRASCAASRMTAHRRSPSFEVAVKNGEHLRMTLDMWLRNVLGVNQRAIGPPVMSVHTLAPRGDDEKIVGT